MTGIPKPLYWRMLIATFLFSLLLFVFSLSFAWWKAKEERNKLCLVLYAAIDRGEFGRRPQQSAFLLESLPCSRGVRLVPTGGRK